VEQFKWKQEIEEANRLRQEKIDSQLEAFKKAKEKEHHAKFYKAHATQVKKKQRKAYREDNRSEYTKAYREKNREVMKARNKRSYEKHRKKRLNYQKRYYLEHKEEILARRKELRRNDKQRQNTSTDRQHEKLVVGCVPAIQS